MTVLDLAEVSTETTESCTGTCSTCPSVGSCAERIVCHCLAVDEHTVITAIRRHGLQTVGDVKLVTGAGDGCRCCHRELKQYLKVYASASSPSMC